MFREQTVGWRWNTVTTSCSNKNKMPSQTIPTIRRKYLAWKLPVFKRLPFLIPMALHSESSEPRLTKAETAGRDLGQHGLTKACIGQHVCRMTLKAFSWSSWFLLFQTRCIISSATACFHHSTVLARCSRWEKMNQRTLQVVTTQSIGAKDWSKNMHWVILYSTTIGDYNGWWWRNHRFWQSCGWSPHWILYLVRNQGYIPLMNGLIDPLMVVPKHDDLVLSGMIFSCDGWSPMVATCMIGRDGSMANDGFARPMLDGRPWLLESCSRLTGWQPNGWFIMVYDYKCPTLNDLGGLWCWKTTIL